MTMIMMLLMIMMIIMMMMMMLMIPSFGLASWYMSNLFYPCVPKFMDDFVTMLFYYLDDLLQFYFVRFLRHIVH